MEPAQRKIPTLNTSSPVLTPRPFAAIRQAEPTQPCRPSPCGPNSQCRELNGQAVCSCLELHIGLPPNCRPECVLSTECPTDKACISQRCQDPCPGTCGLNAECRVRNHSPLCQCRQGFTGDSFTRCYALPRKTWSPLDAKEDPVNCYKPILAPPPVIERVERDPCQPSPCGLNSQCRNVQGVPSCSCLPEFLGAPPNCRPECTISAECSSNLACIREKCIDPCPGSCGYAAECNVVNHTPICVCPAGFTGDPFASCRPAPPEPVQSKKECPQNEFFSNGVTPPLIGEYVDPCNPSPCGPNAQCNGGVCTCLAEFHGDPYSGCRPECVLNSDCPRDKACLRSKCVNPCPGTCGENAICDVINHIPMCRCPDGTAGSAFIRCSPVQSTSFPDSSPKNPIPNPPLVSVVTNPCRPSPCGPNSQCREVNQQAVCSCLPSFIGAPPSCRPECTSNAECAPTQACLNQRCGDPCPGTCGVGAKCAVVSHSPFCTCPERFTGNPFVRCQPQSKDTDLAPRELDLVEPYLSPVEPIRDVVPTDPCRPSPCGPYAQCRPVGEAPACSCLETYIGRPPNCRPECVTSSDCISQLACVNQKCVDPCLGRCGLNAECRVVSHAVQCICQQGFTGDPFVQCSPEIVRDIEVRTPCSPSPCGTNAVCRDRNGVGSCQCLPEYFGDPYQGCRPECMLDSDCPSNRACQQLRCQDPCPGTCGLNANCQVVNHLPTCNCLAGYVGDPYRQCTRQPERKELPALISFHSLMSLPCLSAPNGVRESLPAHALRSQLSVSRLE